MGTIPHKSRIFVAAASLLVVTALVAAQGTRFEGKVPFQIDKSAPLTAEVGPVKVTTIKITNMGRGYGRGGLSLRSASPPSELSTTLRFAFDVDNPGEEWDVTFTVELLDKAGKVIDRASKTENYEEEAKVLNLDHAIIEYVLPMIAEVRVTLQGRRS